MTSTFSLPDKPTYAPTDFEFLQDPRSKSSKLGSGSFASVKLAREVKSGKPYAIKLIDVTPPKLTPSNAHNLRQEINIHRSLDHANIIKFNGCFHQDPYVYLVLDYAEHGNLYSHIHKKKTPLHENEIFKFFYQSCRAIDYLHKNNIMHRDLKPENLLLDKDYNIKLCDFGWSTQNINDKRLTFCGTYEYMAPEIINKIPYDYRIDIWSLGILLYELWHLEAPYKGRNLTEITRSQSRKMFNISAGVHPDAKDLIVRIIKMDPAERMGLSEILNHSWVTGHLARNQAPNDLNIQRFASVRSLQIETQESERLVVQTLPETAKSCTSLLSDPKRLHRDQQQPSEYLSSQSSILELKNQLTVVSNSSKSHTDDQSTATLEDKSITCQTESILTQPVTKNKSERDHKGSLVLEDNVLGSNLKFSVNCPSIEHLLDSRENTISPKKGNSSLAAFNSDKRPMKQREASQDVLLSPTQKFNNTSNSALISPFGNAELTVKSFESNVMSKLNLSQTLKGSLSHHGSLIEQPPKSKDKEIKSSLNRVNSPHKTSVHVNLRSPKGKPQKLKFSLDSGSNQSERAKKGSFIENPAPKTKQSGLTLLNSPKGNQQALKKAASPAKDTRSLLSPASEVINLRKNKENSFLPVRSQIKSPIRQQLETPKSTTISKPFSMGSPKAAPLRGHVIRDGRVQTQAK